MKKITKPQQKSHYEKDTEFYRRQYERTHKLNMNPRSQFYGENLLKSFFDIVVENKYVFNDTPEGLYGFEYMTAMQIISSNEL